MQYGKVKGIDKPISRLVQGTVMLSSKKMDESLALLDALFAQGCNAFDAAHQYGNGDCERVLGQWMHARGLRERVVILTKGAHHTQDRRRVTPFDITADLLDSLARLKTDYIDLYVLHRDDPSAPVGPIVETLNEHQRAGRIRVFGGSNWSVERIQAANAYAHAHGLTPFTVSSPNFSLAEQVQPPWEDCLSISGPQGTSAREWYAQQQMPLFVWSSLAGGFFSGLVTRDNFQTLGDRLDKSFVTAYCYDDNFKRLARAQELAKERGLSVAQVALSYVLNQPLNIFALVGHQSAVECQTNAVACETELNAAEMAWLDLRSAER